ncbi:MAG TPA: aminotransferase class III-fold pyridoxal phosphate-dependent enzyme, partial [Burkholderiaceae bacterium]|nr:aminotransferase class III-fold pyridoxal phosphate-dependent enzyme [Burkholderiaceae bacterium]
QQLYGVQPDLTVFGKVIGGGMPVGAFGGPAHVMEMMAPLGPVYQAGTLSGNPIAMAAGLATLSLIDEPGFFERLGQRCGRLVDGLTQAAARQRVPFCARRVGGLAGMYMLAQPPRSYAQVMTQDVERFKRFYHRMLEQGVYFPPSPVEAFFFSSAHTDADVDATIDAAARAFAEIA